MNVCVHGFGNVGSALAKLWVSAGHTVRVGLRRGSKHEATAQSLGIEAIEPATGAQWAAVNVLALPWPAVEDYLRSLGSVTGKMIIDATNPLDRDLSVLTLAAGSGGQQVAEWAEGARVVKAFNTIGAGLYGNSAFDIFYCGDDAEAIETARKLIADTKMKPVYAGPLKNAGYLEHLAAFWIDLAMNKRVGLPFGFNMTKLDE